MELNNNEMQILLGVFNAYVTLLGIFVTAITTYIITKKNISNEIKKKLSEENRWLAYKYQEDKYKNIINLWTKYWDTIHFIDYEVEPGLIDVQISEITKKRKELNYELFKCLPYLEYGYFSKLNSFKDDLLKFEINLYEALRKHDKNSDNFKKEFEKYTSEIWNKFYNIYILIYKLINKDELIRSIGKIDFEEIK